MLFRILNFLIVALVIFLIWPALFDPEYMSVLKRQVGVAVFALILLAYLWAIFFKTIAFNQLLLSWVLIGFVVLETAMATLKNNDPFASDVFRTPAPYVQFTARPGAEIPANRFMSDLQDPVHIDPLGIRVETALIPKNPGEKRVVVLGGSTVFNGTPLSNTIPGLLEKKLGAPYRVYNFGVVSYVSGQELSLLVHRILALQPDLVITYDGGNDIVSPYMYDPRPDHPYNFMLYEQGARILQERKLTDLLVLLIKKSSLLGQIFKRPLDARMLPKDQLKKSAGYGSESWEQEIIHRYQSNLQAFCTVAKGSGFRYAAILQPLHQFKTPKLGLEETISAEKKDFRDYLDRQFIAASLAYAELSAQNNPDTCLFKDLHLSLQDTNEELYWDFIHTNNRGNAIIANKIQGALTGWL